MESTWRWGNGHFQIATRGRHAVKMGRVDFIVAIATDHIGGLVIGHDKDNVWIFGHLMPPFITTIA